VTYLLPPCCGKWPEARVPLAIKLQALYRFPIFRSKPPLARPIESRERLGMDGRESGTSGGSYESEVTRRIFENG